MLLVGDAGYGSRASLNEDFAIAANGLNLPLSFQMDAWVDTGNNDCWSSVTLGSGQNLIRLQQRREIRHPAKKERQSWKSG